MSDTDPMQLLRAILNITPEDAAAVRDEADVKAKPDSAKGEESRE